MSIYIKLDKQIDANKLLQKIQQLISKSSISKDSFIEINIKNISHDDISMIPKLEHKENKNEK